MTNLTNRKNWRWTTLLRLYIAGWRPSRNVWTKLKLPKSLQVFPEAQRILSEFGGLKFGDWQNNVSFDPTPGEEVAEPIKTFEGVLGVRLYPVGAMEHQDCHYLLVDEKGIVYTLIDGVDSFDLEPLASSFERTAEFLVRKLAYYSEEDLQAIGMKGKIWQIDQMATDVQCNAIDAICKDLNCDIKAVLADLNVTDCHALTFKQASVLTDSLKARQTGNSVP